MKSTRNVYLKMKTLEEAREILFRSFPPSGILSHETIPVPKAVGRVLSKPVTAKLCSPNYHAAAMDGIAVQASSTYGVNESSPKELIIGQDAFHVNTGHVLPENTDAVIMIEHVQELDDNRIQIEAPAFPWQYVRKMGEDIVATELLFPQKHIITAYCVGALLSGGIFEVSVYEKPKAVIFPTGSELVNWSKSDIADLIPGQILETNSYVLGSLIESLGGRFERHETLPDNVQTLTEAIYNAVTGDAHMILTVGGSSAGSEDYTKTVIEDLGEVLIHGVTMMPGKPVLVGRVNEKPVFGMPGYPVSNIVAFEQLVGPLLCRLLGKPTEERHTIEVQPTRKIPSKLGVEEFLRVKLGKVKDRIVATPLPRGAGSITSITEADGIIRIPNHVEGLNENETVKAELLRMHTTVHNAIVIVGSHDNTLDILADQIRGKQDHIHISSSHVGSIGGLIALRRGMCHVAGSHLLNTDDGSYNVSYIKRYLPNIPVKLVNLVFRDQGLIVLPNNPKKIKGIEDLAREDVRLINRQSGSGTRILLDYRLKQLGIEPSSIKGYDSEEFTHMSVAVDVLGGTADVGLGIYAAAKALNLDFIPVVTEQYDLVIPEEFFDSHNIQTLMETIRSEDFKQRVQALGGYNTEKTGEIVYSA